MGQPIVGSRDRISVWIVEDNDEYRDSMCRVIDLEDEMMCARTFSDGETLLEYLREHFAPEVILLDISLPGMNGIEVLQELRPIAPGTAVIMVTIHEDNDRIADALRHGASGYLSKRASADEVVQGIRDVMRGGAAMSPQIARRVLNIFAQLNAPGVDYGLTNREKDVLNELVEGKTKKRIARDLGLSIYTVDTHLRSIYTKLHVNTQTAAVAKALKEGVLR